MRVATQRSIDAAMDDTTRTSAVRGGDPLLGRVLDGRWVIERRLDGGNMGTVYAASQLSVDRKVAIKMLKPGLADNAGLVERFLREAKIASTIVHPHCVTIYDFGQTQDDGLLYLAMELLEGQSLEDRLQGPKLSIKEVLEIGVQIASALTAAHHQHIIHRDLKPANVFLLAMPDGSTFVKVLDFGIAKALNSGQELTMAGELFGTPLYMSPEQSLGRAVDGRSDLYALGCILYEALTGRPPFDAESPLAVLTAHIQSPVPPIEEVTDRRDIPKGLAALCMQLLEKDPAKRLPGASSTRALLKDLLDQLDSSSQPPPLSVRLSEIPSRLTDTGKRASRLLDTLAGEGLEEAPATLDARPSTTSVVLWMLALGFLGSIVATGTVAAVWTWLASGSPDLLPPPAPR